ncbi:MAG: mechanosensitive ion channel family protein [Pseudomonadota bacterium]
MAGDKTVTIDDIKEIGSVRDLWTETVDIWQHGFMGVDIGKMLTAIAIFVGFLFLRGLFGKYVLNHLHKFTQKTNTRIDDKVVEALIPPIKFVPVILGVFFAVQYSGLYDTLGDLYYNVMRSLIVFTIFWALHRSITPISHGMHKLERLLSKALVDWLFKVVKVLVVFLGAAIILELWGIQVAPLLAGLGLFGAAVALGAQDLFKNLIGGVTVLAEKRFHPGEWIKVDGVVEGTVESIGFRSTKVRRFDKAPVDVPNSQLSDAAVINFSRMTHRRIYWMIGVEYRTTVEQLKIIRDEITKVLYDDERYDTEVTTFVRVDSFGASSIDILIYCFTKTTNWGEWLEIKEDLAMKIKEIVEVKAGTGFAFPSQSIYIESMPGDTPEMFVPPTDKGDKAA